METKTFVDVACSSPGLAALLVIVETIGNTLTVCALIAFLGYVFRDGLTAYLGRLNTAEFPGGKLSAYQHVPKGIEHLTEAKGTLRPVDAE